MSEPSLRDARAAYFAEEGLADDGGYGEEWVRIRVGPFPFRYRNSEGRKRLAPAHDVHHLVTGYATDLPGECEIAAWEIGSGLRDATGLWLSFRVLGFMVFAMPARAYRAFVRGRHSRNLFTLGPTVDDALLDRSVDDLRRELSVPEQAPAGTLGDALAFAGWSAAGVAVVFGPLVPIAALLWWWLA